MVATLGLLGGAILSMAWAAASESRWDAFGTIGEWVGATATVWAVWLALKQGKDLTGFNLSLSAFESSEPGGIGTLLVVARNIGLRQVPVVMLTVRISHGAEWKEIVRAEGDDVVSVENPLTLPVNLKTLVNAVPPDVKHTRLHIVLTNAAGTEHVLRYWLEVERWRRLHKKAEDEETERAQKLAQEGLIRRNTSRWRHAPGDDDKDEGI